MYDHGDRPRFLGFPTFDVTNAGLLVFVKSSRASLPRMPSTQEFPPVVDLPADTDQHLAQTGYLCYTYIPTT